MANIECNWKNEWECPYCNECEEFGECVYIRDDEDRCL